MNRYHRNASTILWKSSYFPCRVCVMMTCCAEPSAQHKWQWECFDGITTSWTTRGHSSPAHCTPFFKKKIFSTSTCLFAFLIGNAVEQEQIQDSLIMCATLVQTKVLLSLIYLPIKHTLQSLLNDREKKCSLTHLLVFFLFWGWHKNSAQSPCLTGPE